MRNRTVARRGNSKYNDGGGGGGGVSVTYLLLDEFITDDAAPLTTPRTAEPGPGTWTAIEVDGSLAISSEALQFVKQASDQVDDLGLYSGELTYEDTFVFFAAGIALTTNGGIGISFAIREDTGLPQTNELGITQRSGSTGTVIATIGVRADELWDTMDSYDIFIAISGNSMYLMRRTNSDTVHMLFPAIITQTTPYRASFGNRDSDGSLERMGVAVLDSTLFIPPIEFALLVNGDGSVSGGDDALPSADFVMVVKMTTKQTSGAAIFQFRYQDSDNYWQFSVGPSRNLLLSRVVAGSQTNVANTSTNFVSDGEVIHIAAIGQTIIGISDGALAWSYASATQFETETDWDSVIGDAVWEDMEIWGNEVPASLSSALVGVLS